MWTKDESSGGKWASKVRRLITRVNLLLLIIIIIMCTGVQSLVKEPVL